MDELDLVVLTRSLPDYGLEPGDIGTIVHVYAAGQAYEVEFVTAGGDTVALLTLTPAEVRSRKPREILHVREIQPV